MGIVITDREKAIQWWRGLLDKEKSSYSKRYILLTGKDVEEIWKKENRPSANKTFQNFCHTELVGKKVLYTYGTPDRLEQKVIPIIAASREGFRIYGVNGVFSHATGIQRKLFNNGISECSLLNEKQEVILCQTPQENAEALGIKKEIIQLLHNNPTKKETLLMIKSMLGA
jgi:hypothetical protein